MKESAAVSEQRSAEELESSRLLQILNQLSNEDEVPASGVLSAEDEQLLSSLKAGLASLAHSGRSGHLANSETVQAALDGAEFVARGDIITGRRRRLPQLLPSFTFLVVLPHLGRTEALGVARRAEHLLAAAD